MQCMILEQPLFIYPLFSLHSSFYVMFLFVHDFSISSVQDHAISKLQCSSHLNLLLPVYKVQRRGSLTPSCLRFFPSCVFCSRSNQNVNLSALFSMEFNANLYFHSLHFVKSFSSRTPL
ncbi:hypothetical protein L228DRAFT_147672 [Xylona heveae TC161]|uniref:Uncharacterized protein n=1 Tax=Xylona heveae (strain CBS 132557 / TC161) TaxID=1328760 RepID=A0A165GGN3_XYLHT|nr:hypothetical protein L228DRAFT_147672 [Xylona heveae TC161]KZF22163.1 hypothetical protein L228DRAFT_147672 [Xylona heveae TC161]